MHILSLHSRRSAAAALLPLLGAALLASWPPGAGCSRPVHATGRALLDSNCPDVPHCVVCHNERRVPRFGTVSICNLCEPGYKPFTNGSDVDGMHCVCSPGHVPNDPQSLDPVCGRCPQGSVCPTGDGTATPCGTGLTTLMENATSFGLCVTLPGNGFVPNATDPEGKPGAAPCGASTFSVGSNRNPCRRCQGGTITVDPGSTAASDCKAPSGHYFDKGVAKDCPRGTYQPLNYHTLSYCEACPVGMTTPSVGSVDINACTQFKPGYQSDSLGGAMPCPLNTYFDGSNPGDTACTACPGTPPLRTRATGARAVSQCMAPPGWTMDGSSNLAACARGSFKPGWSRRACTSCGIGLDTAEPTANGGARTFSDCFVPAGCGTQPDPNAETKVMAARCTLGTYGYNVPVFGVRTLPCRPCPVGMTTNDDPSGINDGFSKCLTKAGWGYEASSQLCQICDYGYFSGGGTQDACTRCKTGRTTAAQGATTQADCVKAPGWELVNNEPTPCQQGFYAGFGDAAACTACPTGTTTAYGGGAERVYDCTFCAAGYGEVSNTGANGEPACSPCPSGTYSPGGSQGACPACPVAQPVSPKGASDVLQCFPEWVSLPAGSYLPTAQLVEKIVATDAACRDLCTTDNFCAFYTFYSVPTQRCFLATEQPGMAARLGFKMAEGFYVWYYADPNNIPGRKAAADLASKTQAECTKACDGLDDCVVVALLGTYAAPTWQTCLLRGGQAVGPTVAGSSWRAEGARMNTDAAALESIPANPPAPAAAPLPLPVSNAASPLSYGSAGEFSCPPGWTAAPGGTDESSPPRCTKTINCPIKCHTDFDPPEKWLLVTLGTGCACQCKEPNEVPSGNVAKHADGSCASLGIHFDGAASPKKWLLDTSAPGACHDPASCLAACFYSDGIKRYGVTPSTSNPTTPSNTPGCSEHLPAAAAYGQYAMACGDSAYSNTEDSFSDACDAWFAALGGNAAGVAAAHTDATKLLGAQTMVAFAPNTRTCDAPVFEMNFDTRIPAAFMGTCGFGS